MDIRILIVDDNAPIRAGLRLMLESHVDWVICGEAANGIEAIERYRQLKPDLMIVDVSMPVMNGLEASREILKLSPGWLRELNRRNQGPIAGIYFRVPDQQPVWLGNYGQVHRLVSAAEAIAQFMADDPLGWQVVIPRRIEAKEIHRIRRLSQVIGWRFSPKAKGKPPFCTCKFCIRGEYGSAKLRKTLGTPDDE